MFLWLNNVMSSDENIHICKKFNYAWTSHENKLVIWFCFNLNISMTFRAVFRHVDCGGPWAALSTPWPLYSTLTRSENDTLSLTECTLSSTEYTQSKSDTPSSTEYTPSSTEYTRSILGVNSEYTRSVLRVKVILQVQLSVHRVQLSELRVNSG